MTDQINFTITRAHFTRLTGDIKWPAYTPFSEALRDLAGAFPVLSLRTNKADVVVGVDRAVADVLDAKTGNKWRVNGRYARAVIV